MDRDGGATSPPDAGDCLTCGDVAVPVRLVEIHGATGVAEDREGRRVRVALDFVPGVAPGEVLLVHGGVAIGRLEQEHEVRG